MIKPHGGKLVNRILRQREREKLLEEVSKIYNLKVRNDIISDIQNIATGVFSPLVGFINSADLDEIVKTDHLTNGLEWTIPITLAVNKEILKNFEEGEEIVLNGKNHPIAVMKIEEIYDYEKEKIAQSVFGTTDKHHPGVFKLYNEGDKYIAGKINLIQRIESPYKNYYLTPKETRYLFSKKNWKTIVAFQTRNPPHRAHEYIQKCALEICDGLFINPVIGKKKKGDFTDELILKAYQLAIDNFYPENRVVLSILPWEMRYAGPKEAIFHAIVRKNFGCTHHIIGRDHAGVGNYYDTYAAHKIFERFPELGIQPLFFEHAFYCKVCKNMATTKTCPHSKDKWLSPSGTKIRGIVTEKRKIEPEIMRREVAEILQKSEEPFVR